MRVDRLLTLEIGDAPGQGSGTTRGTLSSSSSSSLAGGDKPDFTIDVSVRRVAPPADDAFLARATALLLRPITGIASVVDLGRIGDDAFVAYRWVEGRSLALLAASPTGVERPEELVAALDEILRRATQLPQLGAPATLSLEQVIVDPRGAVTICDWVVAGATETLDPERLCRDVAQRLRKEVVVSAPARAGSFDAAIGAALAGGVDPATDETDPAPFLSAPRTAAMPASPRRSVPEPSTPAPSVETALTEEPPRRRSPLPIALGAIALSIVAGFVVRALTAPVVAPAQITTTEAAPVVPPSVSAPAPVVPVHVEPSHTESAPHHTRPAVATSSLSIRSDVDAAVYVDGNYAGQTPLVHWSTTPGKHALRVEPQGGTLRLMPRDESVTLAPGEDRPLQIDLQ